MCKILASKNICQTKNQFGFMALMSAIIICFILTLLVATISLTGYYARMEILNREFKQRSKNLAESCAELSLMRLAGDKTFKPPPAGLVEKVGEDSCKIVSIIQSGSLFIIKTEGVYPQTGQSAAHTGLNAVVSDTDLTVNSWQLSP